MPNERDPWSFTEEDIGGEEVLEEEEEAEEYAPPPQPKIQTRIAPGTLMRGELVARRGVEIAGGFSGNVDCQDAVIVAADGRAEGEVSANLVVVEGQFKGTIHSRRCLKIQGEGIFVGDLECQPEMLVLSENARFCSVAAYEKDKERAPTRIKPLEDQPREKKNGSSVVSLSDERKKRGK